MSQFACPCILYVCVCFTCGVFFFFFLAKIGVGVYVWHCVYVCALWFPHKVHQLDVAVSLSRGCCHGSSRVCLYVYVCEMFCQWLRLTTRRQKRQVMEDKAFLPASSSYYLDILKHVILVSCIDVIMTH